MQFIKLPEVMSMTGKRKTAIYKGISKGTFPAQMQDGKSSYWLKSEIEEWMLDRIKQRDNRLGKPQ